ncbi:hypothetical protein NC651_017401 [Populus alba x Populus x berolinensis]|uniref:Uncharacterized protein n=1 Tax=Populus davidiana TaxID=266767 RepID=A0A6M2EWQ6_9ROSI|nr:hypothetical protein NC651_017401 [Populus alba x Populus x berolinensis]
MLKLAGCIKLYPLPLALSLSFKFLVEHEYYPTRESARSLEDEGLRRSTVLLNFSPTKLDHDVYGLKGCLQGFNWPFATRYMVKAVGNYYFSFCLCLNRTSCRN